MIDSGIIYQSFIGVLCLVQGVLDRFSQIQPKVLFSVNAVQYNDKIFPHLSKLRDVVKGLVL